MDVTSPKVGSCQWTGCKYHGEVRINSDYEYLCPMHMKVYLAGAKASSAQGKMIYLEGEVRRHTVALAKAKAELSEAIPESKIAHHNYQDAKEEADMWMRLQK